MVPTAIRNSVQVRDSQYFANFYTRNTRMEYKNGIEESTTINSKTVFVQGDKKKLSK